MSLAKRSVISASWNVVASIIMLPVGFIQSVILARYLPVEYFGIFAGIVALVNLSYVLFEFGLRGAFFHRSPETEEEDQAAAVLFSLRFILDSIWAILLLIISILIKDDLRRNVLIIIIVTSYLTKFVNVPKFILMRRVLHKRIALLDLSSSIIAAILSIVIAVLFASIWALIIPSIVTFVWSTLFIYFWKPVWQPRFAWKLSTVKYYLNFGGRTVIANALSVSLDNIDDLWTNINLGDVLLGYYSRAYKFATYPRKILAMPINQVAVTTYAELKYDRKRLSNALLIRSGFLLSGWLAIVAPEFIRIFLGVKWMPMLLAFRLMLVFTLLDPIKVTIAGVLSAVGKPEKVSQARIFQLIVLIIGLFTLGVRFGISGVALAVDLMLVVGIGILLYYVKSYVDFSLVRLFAAPLIALVIGIGLSWLLIAFWKIDMLDWFWFFVKTIIYGVSFLVSLYLIEGKILFESVIEIIEISKLSDRFKSFFSIRF